MFSLVHPCFEQLSASWQAHGEYRAKEYPADYDIPGPHATDFHRPLSAYLSEAIALGCQIQEIAEPGLTPELAAAGPEGVRAYAHFPNFVVIAATA